MPAPAAANRSAKRPEVNVKIKSVATEDTENIEKHQSTLAFRVFSVSSVAKKVF